MAVAGAGCFATPSPTSDFDILSDRSSSWMSADLEKNPIKSSQASEYQDVGGGTDFATSFIVFQEKRGSSSRYLLWLGAKLISPFPKNVDHFLAIGKYVIIFLIFSLHVCAMIN